MHGRKNIKERRKYKKYGTRIEDVIVSITTFIRANFSHTEAGIYLIKMSEDLHKR